MKFLLYSRKELAKHCHTRTPRLLLFSIAVIIFNSFFGSINAQTTTCPTITNPTPAIISINSGEIIPSLGVSTSATGTNAIRFRYFTSQQTAMGAYGSGLAVGLATPAGGSASILNFTFPANNTVGDVKYYVYAVLNSIPGDATCRPLAEIVVTVKPVPCPTITSPLPSTEITLCSGNTIPSLQVSTSATGTNAIRFRYFSSQQTAAGAYGSGFAIGTATPTGGTAAVSNVVIQNNVGTADVVYYAYAVLNAIPANTNCRPLAEFVIRVKPKPSVVNATRSICDAGLDNKEIVNLTSLNNIVNANTTNTVAWFSDSLNTAIASPATFEAPAGTTVVFAKVTNAGGCFGVARVTLKVAAAPVVSATAKLEKCVSGSTASFNLPDANAQIAAAGPTFTYFATQANASSSTSPIPNTYSGPSTILYARVSNGGGCDAIAPLEIAVNAKPNAGNDQTTPCIDNTTAKSATLTATSTDAGTWSKLTGGAATITTASSKTTTVTGLSVGAYEFVFTTSKSCKDTVKVTVQDCQTPSTCPTISITDKEGTLCSGGYGEVVLATTTAITGIKFVYFSSPQTGAAMYTGGTLIEVVQPSSNGDVGAPNGLPGLQLPANNGDSPVNYYVYAILDNPKDAACRPFAEKIYTVLPLPKSTATTVPVCRTATKYTVKLNISSPGTYKVEVGTAVSTVGNGFNVSGVFLTLNAVQGGKDTTLTFDVAGNKIPVITNLATGCNSIGTIPEAILQDCSVEVDLSLKKSVNKSIVALNEKVTFTLTVFNEGTTKATGVEVTDSLASAAFAYVAGSAKPAGVNFNETTKVWTIGDLNPGDSATLTFEARVIAEGVSFNKAEISKVNEKDKDSTPNNNVPTEDDFARQCVSVPIKFCNTDQIDVAVTAPANYGSYQWFRAESATAAPILIPTATTNAYTATRAGFYTFVVSGGILGTCTGSNCCPIIITSEDCGCPSPPCVPFVIKKTKSATRQ